MPIRRASWFILTLSLLAARPAGPTHGPGSTPSDDGGLLWVGHYNGLFKAFDPLDTRRVHDDILRDYYETGAVAVDESGRTLWAYVKDPPGSGTPPGLYAFGFDGTERFHVPLTQTGATTDLAVNPLDGSVWLAVGKQLSLFSAAGQLLTSLTLTADAKKLSIHTLDNAASLWVATATTVTSYDAVSGVKIQQLSDLGGGNPAVADIDTSPGALRVALSKSIRNYSVAANGMATYYSTWSVQGVKRLEHRADPYTWATTGTKLLRLHGIPLVIDDLGNPFGTETIVLLAAEKDGSVWLVSSEPSRVALVNRPGYQSPWVGYSMGTIGPPLDVAIFPRDTIKPQLAFAEPPAQTWIGPRPAVRVTYSDDRAGVDLDSVRVWTFDPQGQVLPDFDCVTGPADAVCTSGYDIPPQCCGATYKTIRATVWDLAGNAADEKTLSVKVDGAPPTLSFTAPAPGSVVEELRPTLYLSYDDQDSGVDPATIAVKANGADLPVSCSAGAATAVCTPQVDLPPGPVTLTSTVADLSGNVSAVASLDITMSAVDTQPPQLSFVAPASGSIVPDHTPELRLSFSDSRSGADAGSLRITRDGGDLAVDCTFTSTTVSCHPLSPLPVGATPLAATIRDLAGNLSAPASVSFTVVPPTTTVTGFVHGPAGTPVAGATVSIEGQSLSATTTADGAFSISGVDARPGQIRAVARTGAGEDTQTGSSATFAPNPTGTIDVGVIELRPLCPLEVSTDFQGANGLQDTTYFASASALAVFDDGSGTALYVGGEFAAPPGGSANVSRWTGSSWEPLGSGLYGTVYAFAIFDDGNGADLYAAGTFDESPVGPRYVARWSGSAWLPVGGGLASPVVAMVVHDDGRGPALYAATQLTDIWRWDGTSWAQVPGSFVGGVDALASYDDGSGARLIAAGGFVELDGQAVMRVAQWDGTAWSSLGAGIPTIGYPPWSSPWVAALQPVTEGGRRVLYVGGKFRTAGDVAASNVARWDGTSWTAAGAGIGDIDTHVTGLAVADEGRGSAIFAGTDQGGVFRWSGDSWESVARAAKEEANTSVAVRAFTAWERNGYPPELYVGGLFDHVAGARSHTLARLYRTCTPPDRTPPSITLNPPPGSSTKLASVTFTGSLSEAAELTFAGQPVAIAPDLSFSHGPVALVAGLNQFELVAVDAPENRGTLTAQIYRDSSAPTVAFVKPAGGSMVSTATPELELTHGDDVRVDPASLLIKRGGVPVGVFCRGNGARSLCTPTAPLPSGSVTLTATVADQAGNVSAAASVTFTVTPSAAPTTTVTGTVTFVGGGPAAGAQVTVLGVPGATAATGSDGRFSIGGVPAGGEPLTVVARWSAAGGGLVGSRSGLVPVGGGVTDAGIILLRPVCALQLDTSFSAGGVGVDGTYPWEFYGGQDSYLEPDVRALAVYDDGRGGGPALYVGGLFEVAGGVRARNIAKWDGSKWSAVGSTVSGGGVSGAVQALTVWNGALYAGGFFTSADGVSVRRLAKWDGTSWSNVGGGVTGAVGGNVVFALAVYDSQLHVGGRFGLVGTPGAEIPATNVARWNGTSWAALGAGAGSLNPVQTVFSMAVYKRIQGNGQALYVGGDFTVAGGTTARKIAAWNGSSWSAVGGGLGPTTWSNAYLVGAYSMTVFNNELYVGGYFDSTGPDSVSGYGGIARWNGSAWSKVGNGLGSGGLDDPGWPMGIQALLAYNDGTGNALYAAGTGDVGGLREGLYKWNGSSWSAVPGMEGSQGWRGMALTVFAGKLIVGADQITAGDQPVNDVASWDGTSWRPLGSGVPGWVGSAATFDDGLGTALFAGGSYQLLRWQGKEWSSTPPLRDAWGTTASTAVMALSTVDLGAGPRLYAGGDFLTAGPWTVGGAAGWDGAGWQPLADGLMYPNSSSSNPPYLGEIYALASLDSGPGGQAFAGGSIANLPIQSIAAWNGTGWDPLRGGIESSFGGAGRVYALQSIDAGPTAGLYAAGSFGWAGGKPAANIARWDGAAWSALSSGLDTIAWTLAAFDDGTGPALYVGGEFKTAGGLAAPYIARWNGASWSSVGAGLGGPVAALTVFDNGGGAALYAAWARLDPSDPTGQTYDLWRLSKWDGNTWSLVRELGPTIDSFNNGPIYYTVGMLHGYDDGAGSALYVGGRFRHHEGTTPIGAPIHLIRLKSPLECGQDDTTPPTLSFTAPAAGAALATQTPTLAFSYSDAGSGVDGSTLSSKANGVALATNCDSGPFSASCVPTAPLAEGAVALEATIRDGNGNVSAPAQRSVTIDVTPPALAFTSPAANAATPPRPELILTWSDGGAGVDPPTLLLTVDGFATTFTCALLGSGASCRPDLALPTGPATLRATIRDRAGNPSPQASLPIIVDGTRPFVWFTAPAEGATLATRLPEIRLTFDDGNGDVDPATLDLRRDGAPFAADCTTTATGATCRPQAPLADGLVALTATIRDAANNLSDPASRSFTVAGGSAPVITLTQPFDGQALAAASVLFVGSLSKPATLTLDGSPVAVDAQNRFSHGPVSLQPGSNRFLLEAVDPQYNVTRLWVTVIRDETPPRLVFIAPTEDAYHDPVRPLELLVSDLDSGVSAITLEVTANGVPADVVCTVCPPNISCIFQTLPAQAIVTAEATIADEAGNVSAPARVRFTTDPPPVLTLDTPADGTLTREAAVSFVGRVSEPATVTLNADPVTLQPDLSFQHGPVALAEGPNAFRLEATDAAGNVRGLDVDVIRDSLAPALQFVRPAPGSICQSPATLELTWSDAGSGVDAATLSLTANGAPLSPSCVTGPSGATCSGASLPAGAVALEARVGDRAGNQAVATVDCTNDPNADLTPPTIVVDEPHPNASLPEAAIVVRGTVSESATLTLNGQAATLEPDLTFAIPLTLVAGPNLLRLEAIDPAGNLGARELTVTLDTAAPGAVDLSRVTATEIAPGRFRVVGQPQSVPAPEPGLAVVVRDVATEAAAAVAVAVDGSFLAELPALPGDTLRLVVRDRAGNEGPSGDLPLPGTAPIPPDPTSIAPPLDAAPTQGACDLVSFLWTSTPPVQLGVDPAALDCARLAVLHGKVVDPSGAPLAGVRVRVEGDPSVGLTLTRGDGEYDLAVHGGEAVVLVFMLPGHLPVRRVLSLEWGEFASPAEVVLVPQQAPATAIDLAASGVQVARGATETDAAGTRRTTVLFPPELTAQLRLAAGGVRPLAALDVRITEYSVGSRGPQALPADLPPLGAYGHVFELSVDAAQAAAAEAVELSRPIPVYVENYLGLAVGAEIKVSSLDRRNVAWVEAAPGRAVKVLSIAGGIAELDVAGNGQPASAAELAALGIDDPERQQLALLYAAGQELLRMPVSHFSDFWGQDVLPAAPSSTPILPPLLSLPRVGDETKLDKPAVTPFGGGIETDNQIAAESLPVLGTPFGLHYRSDRVPGRRAPFTLTIPLSDATLPSGVQRIDLDLDIAGQHVVQSFPPTPNQTFEFTWDRREGFARQVQGRARWTATVTFLYGDGTPAWGSGRKVSGELGILDAQSTVGLGGWTLTPHHVLDAQSGILFYGGGGRRSLASPLNQPEILELVAGTGTAGGTGDNGPARKAKLDGPAGLSVAPDGSLLIADSENCRIRRVDREGTITTVAGSVCGDGRPGTGDGGPATAAILGTPAKAVQGRDGAIYIADLQGHRIRRVAPDGTITTAAGNGQWGCDGTRLAYPHDIALDAAGGLLIANQGIRRDEDEWCDSIMRLEPGGALVTVVPYQTPQAPGGVALNNDPQGVAAGPGGSIYFTPRHAVVQRPAGSDQWSVSGLLQYFYGAGDTTLAGDGEPAFSSAARYFLPTSLAVAPDGSVYVTDRLNQRVRKIDPIGRLDTIAGGGDRIPVGDGLLARQAALGEPTGIALDPTGRDLYLADYVLNQVWKIRLPGALGDEERVIPSEDGAQLYVFDARGFHLRTEHAVTGVRLYEFGYTDYPQPNGSVKHLLTRVEDAFANVLTIERSTDGSPVALVAPFGQRTNLTLDANGYLSRVERAGEAVQLSSEPNGLLRTLTDPRSGTYHVDYDADGRVIRADDPALGAVSFTYTEREDGWTVQQATAMSRTSGMEVLLPPDEPGETSPLAPGERLVQTVTDTAGLRIQVRQSKDGTARTTYPDGTPVTLATVPDERLGALAPYVVASTTQTPSGLLQAVASQRSQTLIAEGSLGVASWSQISTVNGRASTVAYSASPHAVTATSPEGRQSVTQLDAFGRATQTQVSGVDPVRYAYDARGRLSEVRQGPAGSERVTTYGYDGAGFLASVRDPLGREVRFERDAVGRVVKQILPDLREVTYTYDANGNVTSVTPPSRPAHSFDYDAVDQVTVYVPPDVVPGSDATAYAYNPDHQLTTITRPDQQTIDLGYDAAGRPASITTPTGTTSTAYDAASGKLTTLTAPAGGGTISYSYDGPLPTGISVAGPIAGSVAVAYDRAADGASNFWPIAETLNGDATTRIDREYDRDGLPTRAGPLLLYPDAANGRLVGAELLATGDRFTYTSLGEVERYEAGFDDGSCGPSAPPRVGCRVVLEEVVERDGVGRITRKTETLREPVGPGVETHVDDYTYDPAGRLTGVQRDGAVWETYAYDANGNRTSWTDPWGTASATYDAQDRLLTYGPLSYTYSANGELRTKAQGGQTVTYDYDVLGNLRGVTLADGVQIEYLIDALNRRIGKKVGGTLVKGFLYGGGQAPLAELDGAGQVVSRFIYGGGGNVPDAMVRGGVTYRIVTDHLGSVRWVFDAQSGAVAQRLDYDAFGRVLLDTNPGFQPFGFAGGLYDHQTGLVRFGARDYDAATGRWTSKDPIGFGGGDTNLYGYVISDPINGTDPSGLCIGDDWQCTWWFVKAYAKNVWTDPNIYSAGASSLPIGGEIKDAQEAITGRDLVTGESVGWVGRGATAVAAAIPFVPGSGLRRVVVIGENMVDRVIPYAKRIGATYYNARRGINPANWMRNNRAWANRMKREGVQIIDIGPDVARRAVKGPSDAYEMEREIFDGYWNYLRDPQP